MSEEERLQLLRQRMERKAKQQQRTTGAAPGAAEGQSASGEVGSRPPTPDEALLEAALGHQKWTMLRELVDKYAASLNAVPYVAADRLGEEEGQPPAPDTAAVSLFARTFERMTHFASSLEAFERIERDDQATLLRCGMIEACLIRAAFAYDARNDCWPDTARPQYRSFPTLLASDLRHLVPDELRASHARFNSALHGMRLDEHTLMTLLLIALFSPDRPGLQNPLEVELVQASYVTLLRCYMDFRYGASSRKLFAELLLKLPDLRQLNDAFTQSHLRLSQRDIVHFQTRYGALSQESGPRRRRHSDGDGTTSARSRDFPLSPSLSHPRASSAFSAPPTSASPPSPYYAFQLPFQSTSFPRLLPHPQQPPFFQPPWPRPSSSGTSSPSSEPGTRKHEDPGKAS